MGNGLRLSRKNLSYRDLVRVVEKLEGLCFEEISRGRMVLADFLGDTELRSVMSDGYNA